MEKLRHIRKLTRALLTRLLIGQPKVTDTFQENMFNHSGFTIALMHGSYCPLKLIWIPPPHLSPLVDNEAEGFVPDYAETTKRLQAAARNEVLPMPGVGKEDLDDPQNLLVEGYINRAEANEAAETKQKIATLEKQYHEQLQMELQGTVMKKSKHGAAEDAKASEESVPDLKQSAEDIDTMSKIGMSRQKRGLLEAIEKSKERKAAQINKLKERKKLNSS